MLIWPFHILRLSALEISIIGIRETFFQFVVFKLKIIEILLVVPKTQKLNIVQTIKTKFSIFTIEKSSLTNEPLVHFLKFTVTTLLPIS